MLLYSGVRISEMLDLKKENVHLNEQYFDVICSKTENGIRKVPIADKVLPYYKAWYESCPECEYLLHTEAGKHLKKCVLELGGSNAFIILEDANLEKAVAIAVNARMQNAGQSCIAAKRFLVHENIVNEFVAKFEVAIQNLKTGNPLDKETQIGSLARVDLAEELEVQVHESIRK